MRAKDAALVLNPPPWFKPRVRVYAKGAADHYVARVTSAKAKTAVVAERKK